mmetsp:Transcript_44010/g.86071  ORF Transcript_44010/g.86071 Transcript_44010/m.86071 type:complete len:162 (-) Transcript_44010:192-677(-)
MPEMLIMSAAAAAAAAAVTELANEKGVVSPFQARSNRDAKIRTISTISTITRTNNHSITSTTSTTSCRERILALTALLTEEAKMSICRHLNHLCLPSRHSNNQHNSYRHPMAPTPDTLITTNTSSHLLLRAWRISRWQMWGIWERLESSRESDSEPSALAC